jgi:UDP-galactopyranose mutase
MCQFVQPCEQVNNPGDSGSHIRTLEWKHTIQPEYRLRIRGTLITHETLATPTDPNDFEYSFPDEADATLYQAYQEHA